MKYEINGKFIKAEGYLIPLEQINGITKCKYSKGYLVNGVLRKETYRRIGEYDTLDEAIEAYLKFCKRYKSAKVKRYLIQGKLF